jgi:hypothetical protein
LSLITHPWSLHLCASRLDPNPFLLITNHRSLIDR